MIAQENWCLSNSPNKNHKAWNQIGIMLEKASKVDYGVFVFILGLVFQHVVFSVAWNGFLESETSQDMSVKFYLFLFGSWTTPKEAKEKSLAKPHSLGFCFGEFVRFTLQFSEAEIVFHGQRAADRCRWPVPIPGGYLVGCDVSEALDESQAIGLAKNIGFFQGVHVFMETR